MGVWNVGGGANVLSFNGIYAGENVKVNAATTVRFALVCSGQRSCSNSDFQAGSSASTSYAVAVTADGHHAFYNTVFNAPRATNMDVTCKSNNACQSAKITGNTGPVTLDAPNYGSFYNGALTVPQATS